MLTNYANDHSSKTASKAVKSLCFGGLMMASTVAQAVTADDVMNKMNDDQRFSYVAGVVEALAYARWMGDKPNKAGMNCIHDWLYGENSETSIKRFHSFFDKHPEKPAAPLLYVLIKKECGE